MNKQQLKKLFTDDFGMVTFEGNGAELSIWGCLNEHLVEEICRYPEVVSISCSFDQAEPSIDEITAFRRLLERYSETITTLAFDRPDLDVSIERDPNRILVQALPELGKIKNLQYFNSQFLFVDDDVACAIINPNLVFFSVEPEREVIVTERSIPELLNCKSLQSLSINSSTFGKVEALRLLKAFPKLNVWVHDFVKGWD